MTNLILYFDVVKKNLEQEDLPPMLFLYIAQAFDSISHNIIFHKLTKIGSDHEFLKFFAF